LTLAHWFTFGRILLSPIFVVVYFYYASLGISLLALPYVLIAIAALSELSDLFDGFFARKRNQVTDLGKLIDPMADSIFRLSVFLSFTEGIIQLPLLLVLVLFYRDSIISTLRTVCALRGMALGARLSGKIKAVLQGVAVFFILALMIPWSLGYVDFGFLRAASFYTVLLTAVYTLYTGCEYIYVNRRFIGKALNKG
jgi:CDP-diacylglycerol--glycerol-3-phosphate 3-phosphatidyltransferase